jgi:hypothetical protein
MAAQSAECPNGKFILSEPDSVRSQVLPEGHHRGTALLPWQQSQAIPLPTSDKRDLPINRQPSSTLLRKRENQLEADKLQERKTIRKLRVGIAGSIFVLIFLWLIGVIWLVFLGSYEIQYLHGVCADYNIHSFYDKFKVLPSGCELISDAKTTYLKLPEPIMIALISTTTINVLGLAYIVANWLFPSEKNHAAPVLPSEQK